MNTQMIKASENKKINRTGRFKPRIRVQGLLRSLCVIDPSQQALINLSV